MEGTPSNPRVDEAVKALREKVPGGASCPICGTREWRSPADLIADVGIRMTDPEPSPGGEEPSLWAPLVTLTLVCKNCAFIRQHYIEPA